MTDWTPLYEARDRLKSWTNRGYEYDDIDQLRQDVALCVEWVPKTNNRYGPVGAML